ncbi:MAG: hypothetical protein Q8Q25_01570 [bacterium]|nr:hypothetical protein [bacterium]
MSCFFSEMRNTLEEELTIKQFFVVRLMNQLTGVYTGIVLRRYQPTSNKIALFDQKLGRIDGIFFESEMILGSLLNYFLKKRADNYFLDNYEIIDMPLAIARLDLLFVHHVLELCYYFIPLGSTSDNVFSLLMLLYTKDYVWTSLIKKIFLFKLLTIIGFYPEHPLLHKASMQYLLIMPIDKIVEEQINLDCEKDLHNWLRFCMAHHPSIDCFKTMSFLNESRLV